MTLPIGIEDDFRGVVDLLTQKAWIWDDSGDPTKYTIEEIPTDLVDKANELREKLIETAVEQDDDVMEKYLDGIEPEMEAIKSCIERGQLI